MPQGMEEHVPGGYRRQFKDKMRKVPETCRYWRQNKCIRGKHQCSYVHGFICVNDGHCWRDQCTHWHFKQRRGGRGGIHKFHPMNQRRRFQRSRSRSGSPRGWHKGPQHRMHQRRGSHSPRRSRSGSPSHRSRSRSRSHSHSRRSRSYSYSRRSRSRSPRSKSRSREVERAGSRSESPFQRREREDRKESRSRSRGRSQSRGRSRSMDRSRSRHRSQSPAHRSGSRESKRVSRSRSRSPQQTHRKSVSAERNQRSDSPYRYDQPSKGTRDTRSRSNRDTRSRSNSPRVTKKSVSRSVSPTNDTLMRREADREKPYEHRGRAYMDHENSYMEREKSFMDREKPYIEHDNRYQGMESRQGPSGGRSRHSPEYRQGEGGAARAEDRRNSYGSPPRRSKEHSVREERKEESRSRRDYSSDDEPRSSKKAEAKDPSMLELQERIARDLMNPQTQRILKEILKQSSAKSEGSLRKGSSPSGGSASVDIYDDLGMGLEEVGEEVEDLMGKSFPRGVGERGAFQRHGRTQHDEGHSSPATYRQKARDQRGTNHSSGWSQKYESTSKPKGEYEERHDSSRWSNSDYDYPKSSEGKQESGRRSWESETYGARSANEERQMGREKVKGVSSEVKMQEGSGVTPGAMLFPSGHTMQAKEQQQQDQQKPPQAPPIEPEAKHSSQKSKKKKKEKKKKKVSDSDSDSSEDEKPKKKKDKSGQGEDPLQRLIIKRETLWKRAKFLTEQKDLMWNQRQDIINNHKGDETSLDSLLQENWFLVKEMGKQITKMNQMVNKVEKEIDSLKPGHQLDQKMESLQDTLQSHNLVPPRPQQEPPQPQQEPPRSHHERRPSPASSYHHQGPKGDQRPYKATGRDYPSPTGRQRSPSEGRPGHYRARSPSPPGHRMGSPSSSRKRSPPSGRRRSPSSNMMRSPLSGRMRSSPSHRMSSPPRERYSRSPSGQRTYRHPQKQSWSPSPSGRRSRSPPPGPRRTHSPRQGRRSPAARRSSPEGPTRSPEEDQLYGPEPPRGHHSKRATHDDRRRGDYDKRREEDRLRGDEDRRREEDDKRQDKSSVKSVNEALLEALGYPANLAHLTYIRYCDQGMHWCKLCSIFCESIPEYVNHLTCASHTAKSKFDRKTWLAKGVKEEKEPRHPNAMPITVPVQGVEFLHAMTAYYCSLCDLFMRDKGEAVRHPESKQHTTNYRIHREKNPSYEASLQKTKAAMYAKYSTDQTRYMVEAKIKLKEKATQDEIEGKLRRQLKQKRIEREESAEEEQEKPKKAPRFERKGENEPALKDRYSSPASEKSADIKDSKTVEVRRNKGSHKDRRSFEDNSYDDTATKENQDEDKKNSSKKVVPLIGKMPFLKKKQNAGQRQKDNGKEQQTDVVKQEELINPFDEPQDPKFVNEARGKRSETVLVPEEQEEVVNDAEEDIPTQKEEYPGGSLDMDIEEEYGSKNSPEGMDIEEEEEEEEEESNECAAAETIKALDLLSIPLPGFKSSEPSKKAGDIDLPLPPGEENYPVTQFELGSGTQSPFADGQAQDNGAINSKESSPANLQEDTLAAALATIKEDDVNTEEAFLTMTGVPVPPGTEALLPPGMEHMGATNLLTMPGAELSYPPGIEYGQPLGVDGCHPHATVGSDLPPPPGVELPLPPGVEDPLPPGTEEPLPPGLEMTPPIGTVKPPKTKKNKRSSSKEVDISNKANVVSNMTPPLVVAETCGSEWSSGSGSQDGFGGPVFAQSVEDPSIPLPPGTEGDHMSLQSQFGPDMALSMGMYPLSHDQNQLSWGAAPIGSNIITNMKSDRESTPPPPGTESEDVTKGHPGFGDTSMELSDNSNDDGISGRTLSTPPPPGTEANDGVIFSDAKRNKSKNIPKPNELSKQEHTKGKEEDNDELTHTFPPVGRNSRKKGGSSSKITEVVELQSSSEEKGDSENSDGADSPECGEGSSANQSLVKDIEEEIYYDGESRVLTEKKKRGASRRDARASLEEKEQQEEEVQPLGGRRPSRGARQTYVFQQDSDSEENSDYDELQTEFISQGRKSRGGRRGSPRKRSRKTSKLAEEEEEEEEDDDEDEYPAPRRSRRASTRSSSFTE